jgi:type II secretion system protein H
VTRAPRAAARARAVRAFTLIELMAVLVIFGLLAAIALPNLGIRDARILDDAAKELANGLEFARARAVMTGIPHRVLLDLDGSAWRIEVYGLPPGGADVALEADPTVAATAAPGAPAPLALAPQGQSELEFLPLPGTLGDDATLDARIGFEVVETPEGSFDEGLLQIVFEADGTSEPARIALASESGGHVTLLVAPLADTVRFEHADDR